MNSSATIQSEGENANSKAAATATSKVVAAGVQASARINSGDCGDSGGLTALQRRFPRIDVAGEYRRACERYGREVEVGWFSAFWLPRAHPTKRPRITVNAEVERRRQAILLAAYAKTAPADWPEWFAARFRAFDFREWHETPLEIRKQYAAEKVDSGRPIE